MSETARKEKWWEGATERQGVQGDDVVETLVAGGYFEA